MIANQARHDQNSADLGLTPLSALLLWKDNYNHGDVEAIARSIARFGYNRTCSVWQNGTVMAGNHGVLALCLLKERGEPAPTNVADEAGEWLVPTTSCVHLSYAEARAYAIADNEIARRATRDEALMAEYLQLTLQELGAETIEATGYTTDELDALLRDVGITPDPEPPEVPPARIKRAAELQAKWQTQPGQLWTAGRHRLLCGDATKPEDVERLLAGAAPRLIVTDPPYGVDYDPTWRHDSGLNDSERTGRVANDDRADWTEAWLLFPGDVAYVWHAGRFASTVQDSIERAGFEVRSQIVWAKSRFAISRGHYHWQHEPLWYAVRKGATAAWKGDRSQTTLWDDIPGLSDEGDLDMKSHGTQKPVECMERPIRNHEGDVYEPFCGSGTTIAAAERQGRRCFAMELDPAYVAVILERLQEMGLQPALADPSDGDPALVGPALAETNASAPA